MAAVTYRWSSLPEQREWMLAHAGGRPIAEVCDWPHLTRAVLGRNGTRPEVVEELAALLDGGAHAPTVKDADGVPIAAGDAVWAKRDGREWTVVGFDFSRGHSVIAYDGSGTKRELKPRWLTHEQPDSWERLRADIDKRDTCGYAGAGVDPELGVHDCERCRFHRDDLTCEMEMALDIFERARALAGVEG